MAVQSRSASHGHRVARTNYAVRAVSFAYCFLVIGLVFWERHMGLAAWVLLAAQFLAYPHLLWLRARGARDPRAAELQHLYLDPLLLGAWMAMAGLPTWVAYAALFSTALNNAMSSSERAISPTVSRLSAAG